MKTNNNGSKEDNQHQIANIRIVDPYEHGSPGRKIANIIIVGSTGQQLRIIIRTKNGKYMMQ
mgnify:FL=1